MSKHCPKCGAQLPEESLFCLKCFSSVGNEASEIPVEAAEKEKTVKRSKGQKKPEKRNKNYSKFAAAAGTIVATLVIFAVAVSFADKAQIAKGEAVETTLVPVTDSSGEPVTDENGENVYEAVTVVAQTEKKGFLGRIIDSIEGKSETEAENGKTDEAGGRQSAVAATADGKSESKTDAAADNTVPSQANGEDALPASESDFQWDVYNGKARIVKYIGNSATVCVPSRHGENDVGYIADNAFSDNASIKKIIFEDSQTALTLQENSNAPKAKFSNLPNLTEIVFPEKTATYTSTIGSAYFSRIFSNCPSLKSVSFQAKTVSSGYCYSQDGAVYALNGSRVYLMFYPCGKDSVTFSLPDNCVGLAPDAIKNNPYITSFIGGRLYGTAFEYSEQNFSGCKSLKSIGVSSQNESSTYFCVDGVLYMNKISVSDSYGYDREPMCEVMYPAGKTEESFTFATGKKLKFNENSFCSNPYIRTVYLPEGSRVSSNWRSGTGISVVYLKDCEDSRRISGSYDFKGVTLRYY